MDSKSGMQFSDSLYYYALYSNMVIQEELIVSYINHPHIDTLQQENEIIPRRNIYFPTYDVSCFIINPLFFLITYLYIYYLVNHSFGNLIGF